MQVENLQSLPEGQVIETDLVVIGGGPAGLSIAREFFNTSVRVLVVESGLLEEDQKFTQLNAVDCVGEPQSEAQIEVRAENHGRGSTSFSDAEQRYGLRCRVFGGSSHAWAGKVAAFDDMDFAKRPWVPYSGWPFEKSALDPYVDRAAEILNLGPNRYGDDLWDLITIDDPMSGLDRDVLRSFFWQFARSRIDNIDLMRFGPEFLQTKADNIRVLINATATHINTNEAGSAFQSVEVSSIEGRCATVRAKAAVLAASAIENPRLLLASNRIHANGVGNDHDVVGRFLMDHPAGRIARFPVNDVPAIVDHFGFFGVKWQDKAHMYWHGLAPSDALQEREGLLNCALYMYEENHPNDPADALKRLVQGQSDDVASDVLSIAASPGILFTGAGIGLLHSRAMPERLKQKFINRMITSYPNYMVRQFLTRGMPRKLTGIVVDGIAEQRPDPESRITLSEQLDPLGVPMARVDWRIDDEARTSLLRLGELLRSELPRADLPEPQLEDWIAEGRPQDATLIDMGHSCGTTRMSDDPKMGVVDANCQVHGVAGLYAAGASVFPTSGHANPTLMIVALAVRLADQIKADLRQNFVGRRLRRASALSFSMFFEQMMEAAAVPALSLL